MSSIGEKILKAKVKKSEEVIRDALDRWYPKIGLVWDTGKDSTVNLFLTRRFERDLQVLFSDTTLHFEETYRFRDRLAKDWHLNLINISPDVSYEKVKGDRKRCCYHLKTLPLEKKIGELQLEALIVEKRWSTPAAKVKEDYFSKRKTYHHVNPLLHWTDNDVQKFTKIHEIPHNSLYLEGYQSIECMPCAKPVTPEFPERGESPENSKKIKERLEALGYW